LPHQLDRRLHQALLHVTYSRHKTTFISSRPTSQLFCSNFF
jgi:hypothetical protein